MAGCKNNSFIPILNDPTKLLKFKKCSKLDHEKRQTFGKVFLHVLSLFKERRSCSVCFGRCLFGAIQN